MVKFNFYFKIKGFIFDGACILFAIGGRRKNNSIHIHSRLDYFFRSTSLRTHTAHVSSSPTYSQIYIVLFCSRFFVNIGECCRIECSFSLKSNACHAKLDSHSLLEHIAQVCSP